MLIPSRIQRMAGIPIIAIGVGILFVLTDLMLAARLEIIFVLVVIYLGVEVLLIGAKKWKRK